MWKLLQIYENQLIEKIYWYFKFSSWWTSFATIIYQMLVINLYGQVQKYWQKFNLHIVS